MRKISRIISGFVAVPFALLMVALACRAPMSYQRMNTAYGGGSEDASEPVGVLTPVEARRHLARFCASRGTELIEDATTHRTDDVGLLVTAVIVSGLGAGLNAVAAVLANDDSADDAQLGFTVAGVGAIGLGSMFFAIREGIASDDLQRAERASADALMGAATG